MTIFKKTFIVAIFLLAFVFVQQANAAGMIRWSDTRIAPPGNVRATQDTTAELDGQSVVGVRWSDASEDEDGFIILRTEVNGGRWDEVGRVEANTINFHDRNVDQGVNYIYKVRSYKMNNDRMISVLSGTSNSITPHSVQQDYQNDNNWDDTRDDNSDTENRYTGSTSEDFYYRNFRRSRGNGSNMNNDHRYNNDVDNDSTSEDFYYRNFRRSRGNGSDTEDRYTDSTSDDFYARNFPRLRRN